MEKKQEISPELYKKLHQDINLVTSNQILDFGHEMENKALELYVQMYGDTPVPTDFIETENKDLDECAQLHEPVPNGLTEIKTLYRSSIKHIVSTENYSIYKNHPFWCNDLSLFPDKERMSKLGFSNFSCPHAYHDQDWLPEFLMQDGEEALIRLLAKTNYSKFCKTPGSSGNYDILTWKVTLEYLYNQLKEQFKVLKQKYHQDERLVQRFHEFIENSTKTGSLEFKCERKDILLPFEKLEDLLNRFESEIPESCKNLLYSYYDEDTHDYWVLDDFLVGRHYYFGERQM